MVASVLAAFVVTPIVALAQDRPMPHDPLLTVAEQTDYEATSSHADVLAFIEALDAESNLLTTFEFGTTFEGRSIPAMTLSDPPVASADEARATGKPIVFAFANIHAGEVCGKEALLMLARDLVRDPEHPFLDDLVLVLVPNYNADGNERFGPVEENRPGQVGPARVGTRANAQGLDLNRDYTKLEAPETRAMVDFLNEWDPHLVLDLHTTNGSEHRYVLTYDAPLNPSGHRPSIDFVRDELLPAVADRVRESTGYDTFWYGNFNRAHDVWATYSALPRFGANYHGLRGHLSVLTEAYSHAPFRDRVLATLAFVRESLRFAAENKDEILRLHTEARQRVVDAGLNPQPDDVVGIRHEIAAFDRPVTVKGWVEEPVENGRPRATDHPHDRTVVHLGRFEPVLSVRRPFGYVVPAGHDALVDLLHRHGIETRPLHGTVTAEIHRIDDVDRRPHGYLGPSVRLHTTARTRSLDLPPGSVFVPTAQPLGNLVVYLLEPESDDSVLTAGILDPHLAPGRDYPVHRINRPADLPR